jgi:hypothetical protein
MYVTVTVCAWLPAFNCTSVRLVVFTVAGTPFVTVVAKPWSATCTEYTPGGRRVNS